MCNETKYLEFKENKTKTYLKTVSAFANYFDGEIRFGVNDSGIIVPLENPREFALDIENQINDSIKPHPNYSIVLNNNGTVSLFIEKGFNTPYLYSGKAYKRNNTASIEVDDYELKRLINEGQNLTFDEIISHNQNLALSELETALKKVIDIQTLDLDILKSLSLYTIKGFNNAASLLADKNDFAGLDIVVFGDSEDVFKKRITLSGESLIKQFNEAMNIFEDQYVYEKVGARERSRIEKIPEVAFREVIANAIVHRAYDVKMNTKVSMYNNRIEIISPGGLVYGLSKEQFLKGAFSLSRNPIVAGVFKRINIIEAFATGIRRTINAYSKYETKPVFDNDDSFIYVTLPIVESQNIVPNEYVELLNKMSRNIKYTRNELELLFSYSKDKTIRILNKLMDEGLVVKEAKGKATLYYKK